MAASYDNGTVETGPRAEVHDNDRLAHRTQVELIEAAVAANDVESQLPKKELFKKYWPGVMFSMLLSLALVMEGMDVGLVNNFFAHPAYLRRFGWPDANGEQHIPTRWQGAIGAGNNCGSILGLLLNGYLQSRFGSRRVYMLAMALMAGTIFVLFFAVNVGMLVAGNVLCGIPCKSDLRHQSLVPNSLLVTIMLCFARSMECCYFGLTRSRGVFQTLTTAYAAEICPVALRGYLTAWVSMCWGSGTFLATGILRGSLDLPGDAGWRVPYALQWIWIPPLLIVGYLAPESPWYLVRRGKLEEAEKSLRRLARKGHYTEASMAETLALMKHTNEMEKIEAESASYRDCFRGTNLRRTGIVCMAWIIQILNGQSITGYAAIMLRSVGMSATAAFNYNMAIQSVNIIATGIAIVLMGRIGRRIFYFYGSSGIGACMLIIGILGFAASGDGVAIATAAVLIIVQCIFKVSLGPTTYVVVAETASNRVRAQTIVLGRAVYICGQIIVQQLNPRMLNSSSDAWNWGAKTGMFYFGLCFIWAVWIWFFLPETKNRSFADIDYLFQKKVNARKFTTTPVDIFEFTGPDRTSEKIQEVEQVEQTPKGARTAELRS